MSVVYLVVIAVCAVGVLLLLLRSAKNARSDEAKRNLWAVAVAANIGLAALIGLLLPELTILMLSVGSAAVVLLNYASFRRLSPAGRAVLAVALIPLDCFAGFLIGWAGRGFPIG